MDRLVGELRQHSGHGGRLGTGDQRPDSIVDPATQLDLTDRPHAYTSQRHEGVRGREVWPGTLEPLEAGAYICGGEELLVELVPRLRRPRPVGELAQLVRAGAGHKRAPLAPGKDGLPGRQDPFGNEGVHRPRSAGALPLHLVPLGDAVDQQPKLGADAVVTGYFDAHGLRLATQQANKGE